MATDKVTRKLAAILATDMVGYSRLMEKDEEGTIARQRAHRAELIDPKVAKHGGRIVKSTGDGLLVEFVSAVDAVRCATEVQRATVEREADVPEDRRIAYRVGINVGDIIVDGNDIFGDGVNVASRLERLAEPGGICLSEDAYRQVQSKLDLAVSDGGEQRLKNISRPVRVYRIGPASHAPGLTGLSRRAAPSRRRWRILAVVASVVAAVMTAAGLWLTVGREAADRQPPGTAGSARPATGATFPVIAVLPFANRTGDAGQEYVADGVTEEVINALGRFNTLRVIGRNATLAYKNRPVKETDIASELGASYLVEGSVQRADRRVRILAELTDASAGTVLWTDHYDGELSDVLDFQNTIARQIAGRLAANISHIEGRHSLEHPKPNPDAYDLLLRARAIGYSATRSANRQFRELATQAIDSDPNYTTAYALLADAYYARAILGWTEFPDSDLTKAESLARQAIRLAPEEPDGHRALGRVLVARGDYDLAQDELRQAIEINPSDANALAPWGAVQCFNGQLAKAIGALEQALQYDPTLGPNYVFDLSVCYYLARRNEDAIRIADQGTSRYPDFAMFYVPAAAAAARLERMDAAARYVAEIRRRLPFLNLETLGSRYKDPSYRTYLTEGLRLAGY